MASCDKCTERILNIEHGRVIQLFCMLYFEFCIRTARHDPILYTSFAGLVLVIFLALVPDPCSPLLSPKNKPGPLFMNRVLKYIRS